MEEYVEQMKSVLRSEEYVLGVYLVNLVGIYGVIIWRMIVADIPSLPLHLFLIFYSLYLTTTLLIYLLLVFSDFSFEDSSHYESKCLGWSYLLGASMFLFFVAFLVWLVSRSVKKAMESEWCMLLCWQPVYCMICGLVLWLGLAWGLFVGLVVVYEGNKDVGFWVGMGVMGVCGGFLCAMFLKTREEVFVKGRVQYFHPCTWIFVTGGVLLIPFYLLFLCCKGNSSECESAKESGRNQPNETFDELRRKRTNKMSDIYRV
ncbi:unnamed protein product [Moneuplotes crassus]|uniref:Transmembrane protein n=1 Tax=Euplotes crassus TaxID=5936 RepID=A0AAD1XQH8_EUPCR|nr:unnamed protein product [Moneuplotes crassus]